MSHRHSCERCRRQKVRCLRDSESGEKPSPGQSIQRCMRCAKAGAACVYNLRLRTRRPGTTSTKGKTGPPSSSVKVENSPSETTIEEEEASPQQMDFDSINWDHFSMFSPMDALPLDFEMNHHDSNNPEPMSAVSTLPAAERNEVFADGQWWNGVPTPPSSSPKIELGDNQLCTTDFLQRLTAQATTVSAQAMAATRLLLSPGSAPPTVLSVHVNEAFEGTKTLVRIVNDIAAVSSSCSSDNSDGSCKSLEIGALVLTTLSTHHHLLAFFKAICDSIERSVESVRDDKGNGSSLHGDGPPPTAQFTMVLQLLVHLSNRLDRSLFPVRPESPISPFSDPDEVQVGVVDLIGISSVAQVAQALVGAMPNNHVKLRQTIFQLQARMERLEIF
ncbi:hypothetical protein QBC38DRAFT_471648 [Podospora fimiseda]|uniref:Zn(2)-C6 fungal-type domain-containing protein n=1 Tax=Podospora fimiseda TaxID=252190 RepID=A0AAN7BU27_9PEZI|nr:hypothetical protein QBC38DRAFT_471648 [Podospora fimiseda]